MGHDGHLLHAGEGHLRHVAVPDVFGVDQSLSRGRREVENVAVAIIPGLLLTRHMNTDAHFGRSDTDLKGGVGKPLSPSSH